MQLTNFLTVATVLLGSASAYLPHNAHCGNNVECQTNCYQGLYDAVFEAGGIRYVCSIPHAAPRPVDPYYGYVAAPAPAPAPAASYYGRYHDYPGYGAGYHYGAYPHGYYP